MKHTRELHYYYNNILNLMPCNNKVKQRLLLEIKSNIEDFVNTNPECSFQNIIEHFGSPQDICDSFIETINAQEIRKKMKISKILKVVIILIATTILLFITILFIERQLNRPTDLIESPISIIETDNKLKEED